MTPFPQAEAGSQKNHSYLKWDVCSHQFASVLDQARPAHLMPIELLTVEAIII